MVDDKGGKPNDRSAAVKSPLQRVGLISTNMLLAVFFALFAVANAKSFIENPRLSVLLIVLVETIVAVLLIIRRDPEETRHTWQTWTTTTFGTLFPFLFRPTEAAADLVIGDVIQIIGFIVQIAALLYLSRSLGLLPAYRGIISNGPYKWVRHPLYTAYVISFIGYLINNQSLNNAVILFFGMAFLALRIFYEEALLIQYPDYKSYVKRVRWRLIPAVW